MGRFDGTAARQLDLLDDEDIMPAERQEPRGRALRSLKLLKRDVYVELARRRRRAQIAARHALEHAQEI